MKAKRLGNLYNVGTGFAGNVFDKDFIAPTLMNMQGGGRQPMIIETKKTGIIACFAMQGSENFGLNPNGGDISKTLKASTHDIAILERVWKTKT